MALRVEVITVSSQRPCMPLKQLIDADGLESTCVRDAFAHGAGMGSAPESARVVYPSSRIFDGLRPVQPRALLHRLRTIPALPTFPGEDGRDGVIPH
jgi:hypothetical protein